MLASTRIVMVRTLSPLVAPEVVIMTTSGATRGNRVGNMTNFSFRCCFKQCIVVMKRPVSILIFLFFKSEPLIQI